MVADLIHSISCLTFWAMIAFTGLRPMHSDRRLTHNFTSFGLKPNPNGRISIIYISSTFALGGSNSALRPPMIPLVIFMRLFY
jgi:hypothetical protein